MAAITQQQQKEKRQKLINALKNVNWQTTAQLALQSGYSWTTIQNFMYAMYFAGDIERKREIFSPLRTRDLWRIIQNG